MAYREEILQLNPIPLGVCMERNVHSGNPESRSRRLFPALSVMALAAYNAATEREKQREAKEEQDLGFRYKHLTIDQKINLKHELLSKPEWHVFQIANVMFGFVHMINFFGSGDPEILHEPMDSIWR
jgi:hypothetical protein